jgi:hypothetical protein
MPAESVNPRPELRVRVEIILIERKDTNQIIIEIYQ